MSFFYFHWSFFLLLNKQALLPFTAFWSYITYSDKHGLIVYSEPGIEMGNKSGFSALL